MTGLNRKVEYETHVDLIYTEDRLPPVAAVLTIIEVSTEYSSVTRQVETVTTTRTVICSKRVSVVNE